MRNARLTYWLSLLISVSVFAGCTANQQSTNAPLISTAEVRIGDSFRKKRSWSSSVDFVHGVARTTAAPSDTQHWWWEAVAAERDARCQQYLKALETF